MKMSFTKEQRERFISKVHKSRTCWLWVGARTGNGYGMFHIGRPPQHRPNIKAHRAAHLMFRGAIPEGLCVCHKCNVRQCVNPDHLYLATLQQNNRDAGRDGRMKNGGGPQLYVNIKEARRLHDSGLIWVKVAKRLGMSKTTLRQAIKSGSSGVPQQKKERLLQQKKHKSELKGLRFCITAYKKGGWYLKTLDRIIELERESSNNRGN